MFLQLEHPTLTEVISYKPIRMDIFMFSFLKAVNTKGPLSLRYP